MTKETRKIDFDDFAAQLPILLDALAREHEQVLVEKDGKLYRVEATDETAGEKGHDPDRVRRILARNTGAMKTVDRRALTQDLHISRQQASRGRPA
jgi:hypothetical protein